MFSSDRTSNGPATASPLNATWLRMTGRNDWLPIKATVCSVDWTDLPETVNSDVGHYHVVYSYRVDDVIYTGKFVDYGTRVESYFKRDDELPVRCNPRHPSRSYYPDLRTMTNFHLVWAAVGAGLAAVVLLFGLLSRHHQN
jgi:hypothetical protein